MSNSYRPKVKNKQNKTKQNSEPPTISQGALSSPHGSSPSRISHLQGSYLPSAFTSLSFPTPTPGVTFAQGHFPPPALPYFHHQEELSC